MDEIAIQDLLTHKQLEIHGCKLSIISTDALVLKHQAISIYNADKIVILRDYFHIEITVKGNNIRK